MKFDKTLSLCVKTDLDNDLIPMLLGEPGIGKSSWLMDLGKELNTKVFVLPCNQLADKADLTGARLVPIQDKDGNTVDYKQMFYPHAIIHDAIEYAKAHPHETPILFMDELNRTTPDITSEALSIPTLREIGSKKLPDNLKVVIAGNDKGNVVTLDEASISRFVLYRVEPCVKTFLDLHPDLNKYVKEVLEKHPSTIFGKKVYTNPVDSDDAEEDFYISDLLDESESMEQITTPRTITGVSRWLNAFTDNDLLNLLIETSPNENGEEVSILEEILFGHVGKTEFATRLLNLIVEKVYTTANATTQQHTIILNKPNQYQTMKQLGTVQEVEDFVYNLNDSAKSEFLVYSLYENENNQLYIPILAQHTLALEKNDINNLLNLSTQQKLNKENIQALLETNTPISANLNVILSVYE